MRSRKRFLPFLLILLVSIILTGCWDLKDINRRVMVVALGLDLAERTETENYEYISMVKLTAQVAIPEKLSGGAGQPLTIGAEAVWNVSAIGRNVSMCYVNLQQRLQDELFLGHTRVLVISEDLAREGLSRYMNFFRNNPEFRRLSYLLISENKAEDLLNTFPKTANLQAIYLMNLIEDEIQRQTMPDLPFIEIAIRDVTSGVDPIAVLISSDKETGNIKYSGLAVFRGDRMVGKLDVEETWSYLQLAEGKLSGLQVVRDVESEIGRLSIVFKDLKRKMRLVLTEKGNFKFECKLSFEGIIFSQEVPAVYTKEIYLDQLENRVSTEVKREIETVFYKVQQKYNADIFGFGELVKTYMPEEWKRIEDWHEEFKKVELELDVETIIRRSGMHM
ncbi:MAG TPA: Ger(x)C family spore germination protein [Halanaerobiales bacterium]|nr:Ger(x)C family spore germination protein [Halanaerobiales bacterium]HPZ62971.1 Ger(x)C family spore germination protein [Halanaerobiales bacterium]